VNSEMSVPKQLREPLAGVAPDIDLPENLPVERVKVACGLHHRSEMTTLYVVDSIWSRGSRKLTNFAPPPTGQPQASPG
jgi:hypothetical protein